MYIAACLPACDKTLWLQPTYTKFTVSLIKVCTCGVLKRLELPNPSKSTGPDGIPPCVLKEMTAVLATLLIDLFQMSLGKGAVPDDWKKANDSPIYKKGEKHLASNYRPVCELDMRWEQVLKHIVTSHMMNTSRLTHPEISEYPLAPTVYDRHCCPPRNVTMDLRNSTFLKWELWWELTPPT